jgi:hypothetical protein
MALRGMPEVLEETMAPGLRTFSMRLQQGLLDLQVLHHNLHDPVAIGQLVEIILQVADADQFASLGCISSGRPAECARSSGRP